MSQVLEEPDEHAARLEAIDLLTDSALAELSLRDLLDELLERTCEALGAETAMVLLLDRGSDDLVVAASRGLPDEKRYGTRVPVGAGFAGRVAASRSPVYLDRVDATTVLDPALSSAGLRALLGVPLISFGDVIGVLHIGCFDPATSTTGRSRCCRWSPTGSRWPPSHAGLGSNTPPRRRCSEACCPVGCRTFPAWRWRRATCPASRPASAATGTTCSRSTPALSAS
ncbi:hypothetical protein Athai_60690 [Actinocatenispora thailandica]|uniref:GAF domain-containing protein n=1 Tax=Actinocatenispora thailandica TaxID=227318 RepID=A0A7R7DVI0_9ACTN|nr:GAF domain-containing protein [Actinocatenispora thailandica]BCJ38566.1 hypothetical protein Athai_60690 [Actinocatenispora thailandica]